MKFKNYIRTLFVSTIFFLIVLIDCKCPFDTRDAEKPSERQSSWIQPTTVNDVLTNLKRAISEKNSTNYMRCLVDSNRQGVSFVFIPDPTIATSNPGVFFKWSREQEKRYFEQLLQNLPSDSLSQLVLSDIQENPLGQDSSRIRCNYQLTLDHKYDVSVCPQRTEGQATLTFIRSSEDLWYIYRWTDVATGDLPPWSAIKACFGI